MWKNNEAYLTLVLLILLSLLLQLNRVKVAEKDKNALEGPKNEALTYLSTENDITVKKNTIYQTYK